MVDLPSNIPKICSTNRPSYDDKSIRHWDNPAVLPKFGGWLQASFCIPRKEFYVWIVPKKVELLHKVGNRMATHKSCHCKRPDITFNGHNNLSSHFQSLWRHPVIGTTYARTDAQAKRWTGQVGVAEVCDECMSSVGYQHICLHVWDSSERPQDSD